MPDSKGKAKGAWEKIWSVTVPTGILATAALMGTSCTDVTGGADTRSDHAQVAVAARGSSIATPTDISTLAQLRAMSLTGNYRLIKDITMTSSDAGFTPIGGPFDYFSGT